MEAKVLERCQQVFESWRGLGVDDVDFVAPKGFSSLTMTVRPKPPVDPPGAFYRHLEGKENAILDFEAERAVFLRLGEAGIAAHCHHYARGYRIEAIYEGRTLTAADLEDSDVLRGIAAQLWRLHQLSPGEIPGLPDAGFFELLVTRWRPLARRVLVDQRGAFPPNEQAMCEELTAIYSEATVRKVRRCLPTGPLTFCHNDTYHGNVMRLADGSIKLLDFEFSCLNHRTYDFSNLFAETVMRHKLPAYPYFAIAERDFTRADIATLVGAYLDHAAFRDADRRAAEHDRLVDETERLVLLSHYKYAMAALPLAVAPIQKIRFIPYAHARFRAFLTAYDELSRQNEVSSSWRTR